MRQTDVGRSRRIAEFEGTAQSWSVRILGGKSEEGVKTPDYAHDVNATMRAARRLPTFYALMVVSPGYAYILAPPEPGSHRSKMCRICEVTIDADPARAAFLALSAYLEKRPLNP